MNLTVTFSKTDSEQLNYNTGTGLYEKLNADGSPMTDADNGQGGVHQRVRALRVQRHQGRRLHPPVRYDRRHRPVLAGRRVEQINWTKEDATGPFSLTAADGTPLTVAPGKSFIAIWGGYWSGPDPDRRRRQRADPARKAPCWQAASLMKPLPPPRPRCRTRRSSSMRRLPLTRPTPAWPRHRLNCRTPRPPWTPTARTPTCSPPAMPRRQNRRAEPDHRGQSGVSGCERSAAGGNPVPEATEAPAE